MLNLNFFPDDGCKLGAKPTYSDTDTMTPEPMPDASSSMMDSKIDLVLQGLPDAASPTMALILQHCWCYEGAKSVSQADATHLMMLGWVNKRSKTDHSFTMTSLHE